MAYENILKGFSKMAETALLPGPVGMKAMLDMVLGGENENTALNNAANSMVMDQFDMFGPTQQLPSGLLEDINLEETVRQIENPQDISSGSLMQPELEAMLMEFPGVAELAFSTNNSMEFDSLLNEADSLFDSGQDTFQNIWDSSNGNMNDALTITEGVFSDATANNIEPGIDDDEVLRRLITGVENEVDPMFDAGVPQTPPVRPYTPREELYDGLFQSLEDDKANGDPAGTQILGEVLHSDSFARIMQSDPDGLTQWFTANSNALEPNIYEQVMTGITSMQSTGPVPPVHPSSFAPAPPRGGFQPGGPGTGSTVGTGGETTAFETIANRPTGQQLELPVTGEFGGEPQNLGEQFRYPGMSQTDFDEKYGDRYTHPRYIPLDETQAGLQQQQLFRHDYNSIPGSQYAERQSAMWPLYNRLDTLWRLHSSNPNLDFETQSTGAGDPYNTQGLWVNFYRKYLNNDRPDINDTMSEIRQLRDDMLAAEKNPDYLYAEVGDPRRKAMYDYFATSRSGDPLTFSIKESESLSRNSKFIDLLNLLATKDASGGAIPDIQEGVFGIAQNMSDSGMTRGEILNHFVESSYKPATEMSFGGGEDPLLQMNQAQYNTTGG